MFTHESYIDFDQLIEDQYKNPAEIIGGEEDDEVDEDC